MSKFEYTIFISHESYINENLSKFYKDGWEEAGQATVKYHDSPTSAAFIYIPMKRAVYELETNLNQEKIPAN